MSSQTPDRKVLLTNLASATGRNVAIFLQELHYVTKSQRKDIWRGSYKYWQTKHFPFWSTRTTEKTIKKAEEMGMVYSCFERDRGWSITSHTKSYGINYDAVSDFENQTGTLLLNDTPLSFSAFVATLFAQTLGLTLNDAFVLFEIRYWMTAEEKKYQKHESKNTFNGSFWDLKSLNDLQKRLPFMSRRTIERSIKRLREAGYIKTERTTRQTLAFTIVADKLNAVEGLSEELKAPVPPPLADCKSTKFYSKGYEYTMRSYDFDYVAEACISIADQESCKVEVPFCGLFTVTGDTDSKNKDRCSIARGVVSSIVGKIGKRRMLTLIRKSSRRKMACEMNAFQDRLNPYPAQP